MVDEKMLNEGVFFDGSSIAGWKSIHESDMLLKPDLERTIIDPFTSHNTLVLFVDILDAVNKTPRLAFSHQLSYRPWSNVEIFLLGL